MQLSDAFRKIHSNDLIYSRDYSIAVHGDGVTRIDWGYLEQIEVMCMVMWL